MIMATPRKATRLWPGMIFGLLGLNICIVGLTVFAANANRTSFAVVPDYDRKALNWDQTARQAARNKELGWELRLSRVEPGSVAATLLDKQGLPLAGADVSLEAFHHAHARTKVEVKFAAAADGTYFGAASFGTPGLWEFRFTVRRGADTFTSTTTRLVGGGGS